MLISKSPIRVLLAWFVHFFTALGAVIAIIAIEQIYKNNLKAAFLLLALAIIIDAVDGTLARLIDVKKYCPKIDGALLDNIIDFLTYVIVPAAMLIRIPSMNESHWQLPCMILIVIASCYQFCQTDAKTDDHFFKGFPSYWNIVLFYLYYWQTREGTNIIIIFSLVFLSFVPIKYIYPSRMQYISDNVYVRNFMLMATIIWGFATIALIFTYPQKMLWLNGLCIGYIFLYFIFSIYRTVYPIIVKPKNEIDNT